MKIGASFDDITKALAALRCARCAKRRVPVNTAGYKQPFAADIPESETCQCARTTTEGR